MDPLTKDIPHSLFTPPSSRQVQVEEGGLSGIFNKISKMMSDLVVHHCQSNQERELSPVLALDTQDPDGVDKTIHRLAPQVHVLDLVGKDISSDCEGAEEIFVLDELEGVQWRGEEEKEDAVREISEQEEWGKRIWDWIREPKSPLEEGLSLLSQGCEEGLWEGKVEKDFVGGSLLSMFCASLLKRSKKSPKIFCKKIINLFIPHVDGKLQAAHIALCSKDTKREELLEHQNMLASDLTWIERLKESEDKEFQKILEEKRIAVQGMYSSLKIWIRKQEEEQGGSSASEEISSPFLSRKRRVLCSM